MGCSEPSATDGTLVDPIACDAVVRATFNTAPDGVVVVDGHGRILAFNAQLVALWQFSPDMLARRDAREMRGHTASQVQDPQAYLRSVAASNQHSPAVDDVQLLDGRIFERQVSPLQMPGMAGALVVRWRDVTATRRAEQRQLELSALLDMAMMGAEMACWDIDLPSGRVSSFNRHWNAMLGYADGEIEDTLDAWSRLVHPDDAEGRLQAWTAHVQGLTDTYEADFRMRHRQGHWVWMRGRGRAVARDAQGLALRVVGTRVDINGHKRTEMELAGLAHTDSLTGILNRRRFCELAVEELARAHRRLQDTALLMIDLDHFKAVNDQLGHAGGDEVLRHFVRIARELMRQRDLFGRMGGEEFAALLPQTDLVGAEALAQRLLHRVQAEPVPVGAVHLVVTASIGVAVVPGDGAAGSSIESAMLLADRALYRAKAQGRNRVELA